MTFNPSILEENSEERGSEPQDPMNETFTKVLNILLHLIGNEQPDYISADGITQGYLNSISVNDLREHIADLSYPAGISNEELLAELNNLINIQYITIMKRDGQDTIFFIHPKFRKVNPTLH